jgi:hypothetical protein
MTRIQHSRVGHVSVGWTECLSNLMDDFEVDEVAFAHS